MKYYVKLALITLLVSVAAAEIFGPMVGIKGYIAPAVMGLIGDSDRTTADQSVAQLELATGGTEQSAAGGTTAVSSSQPMSAESALDSCIATLKSVSLHPEFAQIPAISTQSTTNIYEFVWSKTTPIRVMGTSGDEQNITAVCRIGEDGRFRTLVVDDQELFSDSVGKGAVIGGWRIGRAISSVDRSTNVTVSSRVVNPVVISGQELSPTLVMHCGENKTVSYIKLGTNVGKGRIAVTTTVDGNESAARWSISADGENIYQGGKYISLLRQLVTSSTYSVSFSPSGENPVSLDFNLAGLKAAINPLQEACHWR